MCVHTKSLQSCLTLCDPMDYSPPGPSVHGILQARILEWVAVPSSRGSSWPRDQTQVSCVSCIGRLVLYHLYHMGSPDPIYMYTYVLIQYLFFSFWLTLEDAPHGKTTGFGISRGVIWLWRRYLFSLSFSGKCKMANQHLLCWGLNECSIWDRWFSVDFCFFPLHFITRNWSNPRAILFLRRVHTDMSSVEVAELKGTGS